MKTKLLAFVLFALTASVVVGVPLAERRADPVSTAPASPARIEVVFVLDTTGSMSGLIHGAKENIWSIARTLASAQPTPEVRMGLVAYRDRGDAYVTQVTDLSADLDSVYSTLMDYQALGGGDGPESVNQALTDAVHRISWSQDPAVYKVVFLVGDAPPHMDYPDETQYPEILRAAAARGITVNTILAGGDPIAAGVWQQIAALNQGRYLQVEQGGGAVAVATPYDERLARLSRELDATRVFYGAPEARAALERKREAAEKVYAGASPAAQAKRGAYNASEAGKRSFLADADLVEHVGSGRVELAAVPPAALPEPLRELSQDERKAYVEAQAARRAELRAQVQALSAQRQAYIEERIGAAEESLDYKIYSTVREQAADKGLRYEAAPRY